MSRPRAPGDAPLAARLRDEIERDGPISFARFMELALYDDEAGYYTRGAARIGPQGDYVTASDLGRAFGRCLARQIVEIDGLLGRPERFDVLEFGAGRGLLARDVIDALAEGAGDLARRLRYRMLDRSPAMREAASRVAPEAEALPPSALAADHHGVVLAVELFDALPVTRLRRRAGRLLEVAVGLAPTGEFAEVERPAPEPARALAARYGAAPVDGAEAEVALELPRLLGQVAAPLRRGVLLIVDYGERAHALYGPARARGTLQAYRRHATSAELLRRVGEQDLTAHVNFSALEDAAREIGLDVAGLTTLDRFLIANGVLEEFEQRDLGEARDPRRVKRRLQALPLIHPGALGRRFRVLVLGRGLRDPQRLRGLTDPFASGRDAAERCV